jgi:catechol 2,3-dioxygenase-like lactoylglutathione lyase family enzyme
MTRFPFVLAAAAALAVAQVEPWNPAGVSMGHVHIVTSDPDAHRRIWIDTLGGNLVKLGPLEYAEFPGVLVGFRKGESNGGTEGSVVDHLGFLVRDLAGTKAKLEAAGVQIVRVMPATQQFFAMFPGGVKVEFTGDASADAPIKHHHVHFASHDVDGMRDWYARHFGAVPGMRAKFKAADLPGVNLSWNPAEKPLASTKGRVLDHIGFEVRDIHAFAKKLESAGVKLEMQPTRRDDLGLTIAFLVDPWGTRIELTEGLAKPHAEITNGLITARMFLPDAERGYYRGTRFDWSGQIHSLTYNGHEYFGRWFEKYDPKLHDAIMGPVEEFISEGTSVGYDDAKPGQPFVRIGVGAVRRPDDKPFERFRTYDIVDPGKWTIERQPGAITFVHELGDTNGYAYRYRKTMQLIPGKPAMSIEHVLENQGRKGIRTSQYNHNFFVLDRRPTGPGAVVEFPFDLKPTRPQNGDAAEVRGGRIAFTRELKPGESFSGGYAGSAPLSKVFDIRVTGPSGATVLMTGDRPISKVVFWSIRSTFCPEPYIDVSVDPGQTTKWTYRYEFGVGARK